MKEPFLVVLFLFLYSSIIFAQSSFEYPVYLIGDAGEDTIAGKALLMLQVELIKNPNSAVIFLGDNVYPSGLKKSNLNSEKHLLSQLRLLNNYRGKAYFIPGNHDWNAQKRNGLNVLKNQEEYINYYLKTNSNNENKNEKTFLPTDGLPGPASVLLTPYLRLIIIDTQWFLNFHKKNKFETNKKTKELFYFNLDSLLNYSKQNNQQVLITAHHPLYSNGQHSRKKQPFRFLVNCSPFQIFGLLGLNRLFSQDLAAPRYKLMRRKLLYIISKYNNIVYASGHEHNVQCFRSGENKFIVSGNGSKLNRLRRRQILNSVFQDDSKTGFVKIIFTQDGKNKTEIFREGEETKTFDDF